MKRQMILWGIIAFFTLQLVPAQKKQNAPLMRNEQVLPEERQNLHKSGKTTSEIDLVYVNSILWTQVTDVKVSGNYAYCAFANGLVILDITNKSNPTFVSRLYLEGGTAHALSIYNNYAYIAGSSLGLQIVNISNPALLVLVGSYDTPGYAYDVAVSGGYAYVADYGSGLQIINISNPAAPTLVRSYNIYGSVEDVAVSGNYAYIADGYFEIINVSNPATPTLVSGYDTPGSARGVAVSGEYAYVADGSSGLSIINISNPASPVFAGGYNTPGYSEGVTVSGGYIYVADEYAGLQIINVSNPLSPVLSGSYDTPGYAYGVTVSGSYAYVADGNSGLQIINISNPAAPTLAGGYDTPDWAEDVAVSSNYVYVASSGSLMILQSTVTSVEGETPVKGKIPNQFNLLQNYPNPFNPVTKIEFALPKLSPVKLVIYDITGREVAVLVNCSLPAGFHSVQWDARNAASGIYIYRITAGSFTQARRMTVIK